MNFAKQHIQGTETKLDWMDDDELQRISEGSDEHYEKRWYQKPPKPDILHTQHMYLGCQGCALSVILPDVV